MSALAPCSVLMNVRVIVAEIVELKGKPGQVIETEVKNVQGINTITVQTDTGAIVAEGFGGQEISVYSADGRVIASRKAGDVETFRTAPGVYVVRAGDFTSKVIVR